MFQTPALRGFAWALLLALLWTPALAAKTYFDLQIVRSADRRFLSATWYPGPAMPQRFVVDVRDLTTEAESQSDTLAITEWSVATDPAHEYAIRVRALNTLGNVSGETPEEVTVPETGAMRPLSRAQAGLDVEIVSLDPGNFPLIFGTARVSRAGTPLLELGRSQFSVRENGTTQTEYFDVTPPGLSGGVRAVDFVFLIDNSGSMSDQQEQVRSEVQNFVALLSANNVDYRLGLVRFGQSANGGYPLLVNGGNLTSEASIFSSWLGGMTIDGGFEPGLMAVSEAATGMAFRAGVPRVFLLVTDEDSDAGSLTQGIADCVANNIVVHVAVDCGSGNSYYHYCDVGGISGGTGGAVFPVVGPYNQILDTIGQGVASTYVFRYLTSNPTLDGMLRFVDLEVGDGPDDGVGSATYRPGAAPIIARTPATMGLSQTAQVDHQALDFEVIVTDAVSPGVQNVWLHTRTAGASEYAVRSMTFVGLSSYRATLPASEVVHPGIQYYVSATDGQATTTDPSADASFSPHHIAVLPNVAPSINHAMVTGSFAGDPVAIEADIVDQTLMLQRAWIEYQAAGDLVLDVEEMALVTGNRYQAVIPGEKVRAPGLRYRIRASDNYGLQGVTSFFDVPVTPRPSGLTIHFDGNPVFDDPGLGTFPGAFVVGSARFFHWSFAGPADATLETAWLEIQPDAGPIEVVDAIFGEVGGLANYRSVWVVPKRNFVGKMRVSARSTDGRTGASQWSDSFQIHELRELVPSSGDAVGCIYEFNEARILGPASGSVSLIAASLGLCDPSVPSSGVDLNADGTFRLPIHAGADVCKPCVIGDGVYHIRLRRDGDTKALWSLQNPNVPQYIGLAVHRTIKYPFKLSADLQVHPSVFVEDYQVLSSANPALVLVNGWTEQSGAWGSLRTHLVQQGRDAWPVHYTSFGTEAALAGQLVAQGIDWIVRRLKIRDQVDVLAHSFGSLAIRAYVQSAYGSTHYRNDVRKIVFLNGPNHGSHNATTVIQDPLSKDLAQFLKCSNDEDPIVRDLAIGSGFLQEINVRALPNLETGSPPHRPGQYISFASSRVTDKLVCGGMWESSEADGPVSVASASLIEWGVPLVVDDSYDHSQNQNSPQKEVATAIGRFLDHDDWSISGENILSAAIVDDLNDQLRTGARYVTGAGVLVDGPSGYREGGHSFRLDGRLGATPNVGSERKIRLKSAARMSVHGRPGNYWIWSDNVEQYRATLNSSEGLGRFNAWGWKASESFDNCRLGNCHVVDFDPVAECEFGARTVRPPSDEDITLPSGLYWVYLGGNPLSLVNVKSHRFVYDGDVSSRGVSILAASPVDLTVTTSSGDMVGPGGSTIPGAVYDAYVGDDGERHVLVQIPESPGGAYSVAVTPVAGAPPGSNYSLFAFESGLMHTLAMDTPIENIPPGGYTVETEAAPLAPAAPTVTPGAASLAIQWTPEPGIAAYRVFYRTEHGGDLFSGTGACEGGSGIEVPSPGAAITLNCLPDSTFYVAIAAVDADGRQSAWSTEVAGQPITNLITNNSFEGGLEGWNGYANTPLSLSSPGLESEHAVLAQGSATVGKDFGLNDSPSWKRNTGTAGTHIVISAWVRSELSTSPVRLRIREYVNRVRVGNRVYSEPVTLSTMWQQVRLDYVTRASNSTLDFQILCTPDTPNEAFIVDQVAISKLAAGASTPIPLVHPIPGETVSTNRPFQIEWVPREHAVADSSRISVTFDGGEHWSMVGSTIEPSTFAWNVPDVATQEAAVWVESFDEGHVVADAVSDLFELEHGTVEVHGVPRVPDVFYLAAPRPTPFSTETILEFGVPTRCHVQVVVYDVRGRWVRTLSDRIEEPGVVTLRWDGRDARGALAAAGVYLVRLRSGDVVRSRRTVLVR